MDYRQLAGFRGKNTKMASATGETSSVIGTNTDPTITNNDANNTLPTAGLQIGGSKVENWWEVDMHKIPTRDDHVNGTDNGKDNGRDHDKKNLCHRQCTGSTCSRKTNKSNPSMHASTVTSIHESTADFNRRMETITDKINKEHGNVSRAIDTDMNYIEDDKIPLHLEDDMVWKQVLQAHYAELKTLQQTEQAQRRREELVALKASISEKRRQAYMADWKLKLEEKQKEIEDTTSSRNEEKGEGTV